MAILKVELSVDLSAVEMVALMDNRLGYRRVE